MCFGSLGITVFDGSANMQLTHCRTRSEFVRNGVLIITIIIPSTDPSLLSRKID